ncbi:hypothetical protein AX16_009948 [Volvariella volvacea WC 439]|nr:hypothetical protein AX16_009948 [Volvariella volvacea WC 439]
MRLNFALAALLAPLAIPAVTATIQLDVPTNPVAGQLTDITWRSTSSNDPPTFGLFLMNSSYVFGLHAILSWDLKTSDGIFKDVLLPANLRTADTYILKAINQTNVDMPYGWSPIFTIQGV